MVLDGSNSMLNFLFWSMVHQHISFNLREAWDRVSNILFLFIIAIEDLNDMLKKHTQLTG